MGRILIGADVVPTESNIELFATGDIQALLGKTLCDIFNDAEIRIFNLEVPLTDIESPIIKCGPNLIAPRKTIIGYKALGVDIVSLANNHIMDQDTQGFESTCELLIESGIQYVGAGKTPAEATKPYIFEYMGRKVGIYACAEHEFTIVSDQKPGANPFDPLESPDHIAELKQQSDYVIVLYHGGKEHYRYPSPNLQKICRKLVDKGADLVLCQHSHCIGCKEEYNGGTIVYGQGNLLFDYNDSEFWQTSLLVCINENFSVSYLPLVKEENVVRLAEGEQAENILNGFYERSEEILEEGAIKKRYAEFTISMQDMYLRIIAGKSSLTERALNKLTGGRLKEWIFQRRYPQRQLLAVRNYIECEAHWELLVAAIMMDR